MRLHTTILLTGKTACGMRVPSEMVEALGAGKRPPVRVTINGHTYRTSIAPMDGAYWIGVSAENRSGAGVKAGEDVEVQIELDSEPREVLVPHDLSIALDGDAAARRFFDGLSYSNKRRLVIPIEGAKAVETRRRRIEKTIDQLRTGRI